MKVSRAFFHAKSAQELLDSTLSMEDPSERLFVLRKWISQHPFIKDALDVVESAINDAIRISEFTPNATFYREISTPLSFADDSERRQRIVAVIDGQNAIMVSKGPTVDYVRLQLQLAHCNFVDSDLIRAASRLEDLYFNFVDPIVELETRITCLAWFASELQHFDSLHKINEHSPIREIIDDDLEATLAKIVENGANHFAVLSSALSALALHLPNAALTMARRLNTIDRRNEAFFHIAVTMCRADTIVPCADVLFDLLDAMQPGIELDSAIREISNRFAEDVASGKCSMMDMRTLETRLNLCSSTAIRVKCLGTMADAIAELPECSSLYETVSERLLAEFASIGMPSDKYHTACQLIAELKSSCPELAAEIFGYIADPKRGVTVSENVEQGLFYVLDLLVKSTCGLAHSKLLRPEDVRSVCELIDSVSDPLMKTTLFATLAFCLWREEAADPFSEVLNSNLWPTLSSLLDSDPALQYRAWTAAYPAVWLEDRDRARNEVASFPVNVRNDCTSALIFSLLRGQPQAEPFDHESRNMGSALTFRDIRILVQLCDEIDDDQLIYLVFEWIADDVESGQAEARLTRDQQAEISRGMFALADKKLPIKHRIQHNGFQILCKCQALRIYGSPSVDWSLLISQGEEVANTADRLFILGYIASYLPNKRKDKRTELLRTVEMEIGELHIQEDQYQLYCTLSNLVVKKDKKAASRIVEKIFAMLQGRFDRRNAIRENRLVDLAYRVDPELPMRLAVLYDDDPAREKYKERAQRQVAAHQLKRDLGDYRSQVDLMSLRDDAQLANAAWRALGTLNSGRMVATDMSRVRDMLMCAGTYPLKTSYPMYSWALTNVMLKYANTPEAPKYLRSMFEGILRGVRFFFQIVDPDSQTAVNPAWRNLGDSCTQVVLQNGERDKALKFLEKWIEENAEEYITIIDPYFGVSDLYLLVQIVQIDPWIKVRIVTGKAPQKVVDGSLSSAYSEAWRGLCDHSPPETEILVVGSVLNGSAPFHDRWILSRSAGVHLGTSINSLGNRDSVITILGSEDLTKIKNMIKKYQSREVREVNGDRLSYELFELIA